MINLCMFFAASKELKGSYDNLPRRLRKGQTTIFILPSKQKCNTHIDS